MDITFLKCGDGEGLTFVFFNGANPKPGLATEPFCVNADANSSCDISIFPLASFLSNWRHDQTDYLQW
jgi:hypothetical protein